MKIYNSIKVKKVNDRRNNVLEIMLQDGSPDIETIHYSESELDALIKSCGKSTIVFIKGNTSNIIRNMIEDFRLNNEDKKILLKRR